MPDPAVFSLDNTEFAVGTSSPLSPNPYSAIRTSPVGDLLDSPAAEWGDTPRTLYKTSPGTEVGDNDVLSDLEAEGTEEGPSFIGQAQHSSLFTTSPQHQPIPEGTPLFACTPSPEEPFQTLARRLHNDIRSTSSLFPGFSFEAMPRSSTSIHQVTPSPRLRVNTAIPETSHTIATTAIPHSLSIPRKRSMHLKHPSYPINPYQRPKAGEDPPTQRYPAAVVDRVHLRRFMAPSPPQRTVTMKELLVPHAEFHFGYDPEAFALELDPPSTFEFKSSDEHHVDEVHVISDSAEQDANISYTNADGICVSSLTDDSDALETLDNADDGAWTPEASSEGLSGPHPKRRRINVGIRSDIDSDSKLSRDFKATPQASLRTRRVHHEANKARKRHLQPNLVRTNGCLYGCPLLFSTAYEARRHQEDTHGREEAYSFIKAASGDRRDPILSKDYRFLLQIAAHALGDKLDPGVRATLDDALEREDEELEAGLVQKIAKFALDWTKRNGIMRSSVDESISRGSVA
ncbi:hypothetical protein FRC00_003171 [Tulasnella sp. 408]|nr:hypothetical protein FRC00_003171 [Tulasnella sp. 408]